MAKIPDIAPFRAKLDSLDAQIAEPNFYSDQRRAAEVGREHQRVSSLIEKFSMGKVNGIKKSFVVRRHL